MSRSGYTDEDENNTLGLWRNAVNRAIQGARGQKLLRELADALDAMPVKELAAHSLVNEHGQYCTLGAIGAVRGINIAALDPEDWDSVAKAFDIAPAMAREIVYENDESIIPNGYMNFEICGPMRPYENRYRSVWAKREGAERERWLYMRKWVESKLKKHQEATQ